MSLQTSRDGVSSRSAFFTAALVLQRGLPFLALPLVARAVTQETFGIITLITTVATVGAVVLSLGLNGAVPRLIYDEPLDGTPTAWSAMLRVQMSFATGVLALAIGTLVVLGAAGHAEINAYLVLTPVLATSLSVHYLFQGVAIARGAAVRSVVAAAVQVTVGAGVGPWLAFEFGGTAYLAAISAASLIAAAILSRPASPPPRWEKKQVRDGLCLAVPFAWQGLSTWLLSLSDRVILALYFTLVEVGVYQVSYMVGSAVGLVLEGVQSAWAPQYYRSQRSDNRAGLLGLVPAFVVTSALAALLLTALSPLVVGVVAPGYRVDLAVLGIVALAAVPRSLYFVLVADLLERKLTRSIALSTFCGAAVAVGVDFALLPWAGLWLAATATVLAFAVQAVIVTRRSLGDAWPAYYLRWVMAPLGVTAAAMLPCVVIAQRARLVEVLLLAAVLVGLFCVSGKRLFGRLRGVTGQWEIVGRGGRDDG